MKIPDFKKILKYLKSREERGRSLHILRDWKIIFYSFVLLLVVVCAVNGYAWWFYGSNLGGEVGITKIEPVNIKTSLLKNVLDEATARKERFEQYKVTPIDIANPAFPPEKPVTTRKK